MVLGIKCAHGISGENIAFLGENIPILDYRKQPLFGCKKL
jgi:hypothetical protein